MIPRDTAVRTAIPRAAKIWIGNLFRGRCIGPYGGLIDFYNTIGTKRECTSACGTGSYLGVELPSLHRSRIGKV